MKLKWFRCWTTRRSLYRQSNQVECFWCVSAQDDVVVPTPLAVVRRGSPTAPVQPPATSQPTAAAAEATSSSSQVITIHIKIDNFLSCRQFLYRVESFVAKRTGLMHVTRNSDEQSEYISLAVTGTFTLDGFLEEMRREFDDVHFVSMSLGHTPHTF